MVNKKTQERAERLKMIDDIKTQIEAAQNSRNEKLRQSMDHLLAQVEMVSKKYLTVNGYMQAKQAMMEATFEDLPLSARDNESIKGLAFEMSGMVKDLAGKLHDVDVHEIDESVIDGLMDHEFVKNPLDHMTVARELLIVQLLQNIGPVIDDIVSFRESTRDGLDRLHEELQRLEDEDGVKGQLHLVDALPEENTTVQ
jgi:polyhydroxyalkanoate synthesis regulator phasin